MGDVPVFSQVYRLGLAGLQKTAHLLLNSPVLRIYFSVQRQRILENLFCRDGFNGSSGGLGV